MVYLIRIWGKRGEDHENVSAGGYEALTGKIFNRFLPRLVAPANDKQSVPAAKSGSLVMLTISATFCVYLL